MSIVFGNLQTRSVNHTRTKVQRQTFVTRINHIKTVNAICNSKSPVHTSHPWKINVGNYRNQNSQRQPSQSGRAIGWDSTLLSLALQIAVDYLRGKSTYCILQVTYKINIRSGPAGNRNTACSNRKAECTLIAVNSSRPTHTLNDPTLMPFVYLRQISFGNHNVVEMLICRFVIQHLERGRW